MLEWVPLETDRITVVHMDRMATEDTGRKQAKERGFQRTPSCQNLSLRFLVSRTVKKWNFFF